MNRIGKYHVLRKLGQGATSEVYLCNDPFNLRDVAVKVALTEAFRDPERGHQYKKLFLTEASLAGKLQHPHICSIYDAAAENEVHYLVMEYVPGGTLEKFCRPDALLAVDEAAEIAFKCTRALEYAQKLGIIHRDIKPANILHVGGTDVKLTDFGAALVASGDITQVSAVGSPAYMSPEQVREQPLDHRTDVYSIGVVLYHLLAGRLPFQAASNYSLVYQITSVDPQPPSVYRAEIPPALDAIVLRAMQKDVDKRYRDWDEFAADLAAAVRERRTAVHRRLAFADAEKFEALRKLPFFEHFSDAQLWEVARIATWRHVPAGEVLMKEGETGDFFCLLSEGQVKVTRKGRLLNLLGAGEPFGEMSYLTRRAQRRGADVTVVSDANIIAVPANALAQASDGCRHNFDRAFLHILTERLTMANLRLSGV